MYQINGYGDDFYTGRTSDGKQVLMGLLCPELVAYFFSPDGVFLSREAKPWTYPAPRMGLDGPYQIYDAPFQTHLANQINGWKETIGFQPSAIRVEAFFDEAGWVGMEALPAPGEDTDGDTDEETLQAWREQGIFTFYWAKDYVVAANGEVLST